MNRPLHIWLIFGLCLVVLLAAMGWVSFTAVRLDRAQQEAGQQAEVEEKIRLALWRMDSALAAVVIEESARPYYVYEPFHATDRAYTKGYSSIKRGDVVVPSPLLTYLPTNVLVHFQFGADGRLTSPQVPSGNERDLAEVGYTTAQKISAAAARLAELQKVLNAPAGPEAARTAAGWSLWPKSSAPASAPLNNRDVLSAICSVAPTNLAPPITLAALSPARQSRQSDLGQQGRNDVEWNARSQNYDNNGKVINPQQQALVQQTAGTGSSEGPFKAVWAGPALLLARRVTVEGRQVIQGAWLDWTRLQPSLLATVKDLFPAAELQPVTAPADGKDTRALAGLPARLVPGPVEGYATPFWSPIRFSLLVAWACVLLAAVAVGVLLNGAVSLSERRGAFVSAVTHELRTPLTTFKMYSEMLAEGMVTDPEKRKFYLGTLCSEANRLSHLVENVLAYARLERGSARSRVEKVSLGELIERVQPRLLQRVEQVGLRFVVDSEEAALRTVVQVDVSAVEQIIFNLVDNACKYAAPGATEKIIHLEALPNGKFAMLRVRDHGQGITRQEAKKLFRPFSKSAHEAAHSAPGVGLGLALCRRLSRSLGGDLRLDESVKNGACFELRLPIAAA